jgi:hypothetical protein
MTRSPRRKKDDWDHKRKDGMRDGREESLRSKEQNEPKDQSGFSLGWQRKNMVNEYGEGDRYSEEAAISLTERDGTERDGTERDGTERDGAERGSNRTSSAANPLASGA